MKLHFAAASPYVRKVRVAAIEAGLDDRIELVSCAVTPVAPNANLVADNPLGRIPCLVVPDIGPIYDSRVICDYLVTLAPAAGLLPSDTGGRIRTLRMQALADGALDSLVNTRYETFLRPEAMRWPQWIDSQFLKVTRALDELERAPSSIGDFPDLGAISIACALGYLDFRFKHLNWRHGRPELAKWHKAAEERGSLQATTPS